MTAADAAHDWDESCAGPPAPWDIGRPQSAFGCGRVRPAKAIPALSNALTLP